MSHLLFIGFRIAYRSACFVWCLLCFAGCITAAHPGKNFADQDKNSPNQIQLQSIDITEKSDTIEVLIKANGKMKYSAVKQDFPLGVMVYLHDVAIKDNFSQPSVDGIRGVTSLSATYVDSTRKSVAVRILLSDNLNYQVQEDGFALNLFFYKKEKMLTSNPKSRNDVSDIPSFAESNLFPEPGNSRALPAAHIPNNTSSSNSPSSGGEISSNYGKKASVTGIDFHSGDDGETAIVISTSHPVKYNMHRNPSNNELQLNLYNTRIPDYHQRQLITTYFNSAVDKIVPIDSINRDKTSRINIALREKVPYHILQEQNRLTIFLEPSSVKPLKLEGETLSIAGGSSAGPGQVVQKTGNEIQTLAPQQNLQDANKAQIDQNFMLTKNSQDLNLNRRLQQLDSSETLTPTESDDNSEPEDLEDMQDLTESDNKDNFFDENPVYTGEEISLDFYETDIKNVFRILQTVSGENFAVDKNVTGTVTMTLEKPAPWDEILDLVLKMNGLGKIRSGSIVRIATLETIQQEETQKSAILAAKIEAVEQKKRQEPMFTEYIPINYSSAETDIKPHIEKLLTTSKGSKGSSNSGGTISVDKRTNMIILTDTRKKIDEAKKLIYKLDKVTPQILISARIVEVSKNFSREIGVNWGVKSTDVYRDDLGGLYGFDIAMNHPANATGTIGYTFNRLAGTPLLLDAKLMASELTGDTKIISSPKIITLDNKKATIKQGIDYGYQSGVDGSGNPVITFKPIDLSLEVTPQVTPDKRVAMTVKISKNEVSGLVAGIPSLSTSEANTELLVNDGNTIVIGGIVKSTVSEGRTGFPLLSSIPYLGQLFRSDTSSDKKNELLIFITPTIVQLDQKDNTL